MTPGFTVAAEAPSNIALIKYMGKLPFNQLGDKNRPTNSSVSVTLPQLRTRVELEQISAGQDRWAPLSQDNWQAPDLSEKGRERFLKHFAKMKSAWKISGFYEIRSANNFPSDCGLASSASSFAALTLATADLARQTNSATDLTLEQVADMSRQGSGSSIRSFFAPLGLWDAAGAREIEIPNINFLHSVVVVEDEKKLVSSSEAHERVTTSPLFEGRPERAETRLNMLVDALKHDRWSEAYRICWDEFHDMHALFSTAIPPFNYMTAGTGTTLDYLQNYWRRHSDGPIVTMDAGANVHLLYRADQKNVMAEIQRDLSQLGFKVSL
jgi:diphosphomevalonate decarboxylase